jgi:hypothetical protein
MVLLAGLVLVLGPGGVFACLASDDAGAREVRSPSAIETEFVEARDAEWWLTGPAKSSGYGQSVACAGDVDGDYGDDILVGADKYGTDQGEGTVYLYLSEGGGLDDTPAWVKSGGTKGGQFGWSVAGAGDVNNDTYADVIIGAKDHKDLLIINDKEQEVPVGGAFVYLGVDGVGLDIDHTWVYTGTVKDGEFGYAVAGAGDVNGGDIDDIAVGARGEDAIYVFYGSSSGPNKAPNWHIVSDQSGAWFGAAVGAAGDVNDDGYDDLIVGAPRYVNLDTGVREGAVFLFHGRDTTGDTWFASVTDADWMAYGGQGGSGFGTAVAGAGDVNGDGRPDIVVGVPEYYRLGVGQVGAAFVFCGNGSAFASEPCWMASGSYIGGQFGVSAGGAGDVNADGYDEVIVGAPFYRWSADQGFQGAAFLYFGSATGLSPWPGWKAGGDKATTEFGASVGSAGRVTDGDAVSVIVGAPRYFDVSDPYGAAFAFYGPLEPGDLYRAYLPLVMNNAN